MGGSEKIAFCNHYDTIRENLSDKATEKLIEAQIGNWIVTSYMKEDFRRYVRTRGLK
jgi:hypothetical protein